ncbi:MAG: glycoside hydrolase domain-containing protein [Armatimonadia bacterium]
MSRHSLSLCCWVALLILPGIVLAQEAAGLPARLQGAVTGYEKLVAELDLNRLPGDRPDYPLVTENLGRLGERLEALSRQGMRLGEMNEAEKVGLEAAVGLFEADLGQLRQQSLGLRVWSFWSQHGYKKPEWGLAVGEAAEAGNELKLAAKAGERVEGRFVVVPVGKDLQAVQVTAGELWGKAGKIAKEAVTIAAVDGGDTPGHVDVARDMTQGYVVAVAVPEGLKAGEYRGKITVRPEKTKALVLEVVLTVQ